MSPTRNTTYDSLTSNLLVVNNLDCSSLLEDKTLDELTRQVVKTTLSRVGAVSGYNGSEYMRP